MAGFSATQRIFATMTLTPDAYESGLEKSQDSHDLLYSSVDVPAAPKSNNIIQRVEDNKSNLYSLGKHSGGLNPKPNKVDART